MVEGLGSASIKTIKRGEISTPVIDEMHKSIEEHRARQEVHADIAARKAKAIAAAEAKAREAKEQLKQTEPGEAG